MAVLHQKLGDIKADTPGPDHGNPRPNSGPAQHLDIAQGALLACNPRIARRNPRCHNNRIKAAQIVYSCLNPQPQNDAGLRDRGFKPLDQPVEFLFPRHQPCQIQLPAQNLRPVKQRPPMPAPVRHQSRHKARRPRAHNRN